MSFLVEPAGRMSEQKRWMQLAPGIRIGLYHASNQVSGVNSSHFARNVHQTTELTMFFRQQFERIAESSDGLNVTPPSPLSRYLGHEQKTIQELHRQERVLYADA